MSYILDALNKTERAQKRLQTPDLSSQHEDSSAQRPGRRIWILAAALLVIGNIFAYFLLMNHQPANEARPLIQNTGDALPMETKTNNIAVPPPETSNTSSRAPTVAVAQPTQTISSHQLPITTKLEPVRIAELPSNVQSRIPDMKFSSHIYADDPALRMVNINGNISREGDMVADGIQLKEITEQGVVLSYKHYTFVMSVIRDWSFD